MFRCWCFWASATKCMYHKKRHTPTHINTHTYTHRHTHMFLWDLSVKMVYKIYNNIIFRIIINTTSIISLGWIKGKYAIFMCDILKSKCYMEFTLKILASICPFLIRLIYGIGSKLYVYKCLSKLFTLKWFV